MVAARDGGGGDVVDDGGGGGVVNDGVELTQRMKDKAGPPIVGRMMESQMVAVSRASPGSLLTGQ